MCLNSKCLSGWNGIISPFIFYLNLFNFKKIASMWIIGVGEYSVGY